MDYSIIFLLKAVVLGIVEGITEFLPVSSTGHIIIFSNIMGFNNGAREEFVNMFTMVIQLGAILAVIVLYWKKIWMTLKRFFPRIKLFGDVSYKECGLRFWLLIAIACIPGAALVIPFDDWVDEHFFNPTTVAITLVLGGIAMILFENKYKEKNMAKTNDIFKVTVKQVIIIGLFQCLSIIPGMSRSASTIIGAWVAGLSTVAAAEFSFFLAIPVMFGVTTLKMIKIGGLAGLTSLEFIVLAVAFSVAFFVALLVVDGFISFLKRKPMRWFSYYRFFFAIIVVVCGFLGIF